MSARRAWQALAALCGVATLAGCGEAESRGSVMLAISTDMFVNKDLDRVELIVQPEEGPAQNAEVNLFPAVQGLYLPGTFSIIEGRQPGEFVRVRLVARQGTRPRVVREAALRIPRERTAVLHMPIQWLCDGHVRQEGQQVRSDCEDGYTCISGMCQLDEVNETLLATYQAEEVFGGGSAAGGGTCFDTLPCFEQSSEPALDRDSCILATAPGGDLNVAAVLPPGGDGHCTAEHCWIPLDASALTGWSASEDGDAVQLPQALCALVSEGKATIRTSRSCASKTPATPTCGQWTLVGTEPGDEPLPAPPIGGAALGLDAELSTLSNRLVERVARACATVAQQSPPASPTTGDLSALCQQASNVVAPSAPLTWYHLPARCFPDSERQLSCERACSSCQPGSMLDRCEINSIVGSCTGACTSRRCLGSQESPTDCKGACDGQLVGQCQGNCLGTCEGTCSAPQADGRCDGNCDGTCTGLCAGRGEGSCAGLCDGDPNLEPVACSGGALCVGSCDGQMSGPSCSGQLGTSPCPTSGCIGDCGAIGRIDLECHPATSWLLPPAGMDATLVSNLEGALKDLLSVHDAEAPPAIDEATRLTERLLAAPATAQTTLDQAYEALALLGAAKTSSALLINALGPARQGPATGMPMGPPDAQTCEPFQTPGGNGLIDDFEDGNAQLLPNDGRAGSWHVGQDGTGTLDQSEPPLPVAGGAEGSNFALHISGRGFTNWGANVNFELRPGSAPYDASVHQGIEFWGRGAGQLRIILSQRNLAPTHACSTCLTETGECGLFYSTTVTLSGIWTKYILDWSSFTAPAVILTPFGPDQLMTVQFEAPAPEPIDFWIDDVRFN